MDDLDQLDEPSPDTITGEPLPEPVDARDAAADLATVLDWLADDEWLTVAWVVEHSGVPHAVVVDVLDDLVADGIAERWGLSRRYRLKGGAL